jgi:hypothetical protein
MPDDWKALQPGAIRVRPGKSMNLRILKRQCARDGAAYKSSRAGQKDADAIVVSTRQIHRYSLYRVIANR